jgi:LysM repeat protein
MAAPLGFKTFNTGDVLSAADTNGYLMQGVLVFADAAARSAAITSPQEGQTSYLKDTDVIQVYSGSAWVTKSGGSSPLTTKGDLYTYSTTDARLPVGTNGHTLVANSATATGLEWKVDPVADLVTTAGDTLYATAADTLARLAIGTAGQVLQVNSGATAPEWATPAGGGGMTLIDEQTASSSTSINFAAIPGTYKQLLLVFSGLYHSTTGEQFTVRFNNSSATEYSNAGEGTNGTLCSTATNVRPPQPFIGEDTISTTPANTIRGQLLIDNYASSTKFKYYSGGMGYINTGGSSQVHQFEGFWNNTSAITSVDIVRLGSAATLSNIANTSIRLYGIS